jgi:hypothetical protein
MVNPNNINNIFSSPVDTSKIKEEAKKRMAELEALALQETIGQTIKDYIKSEGSNLAGLLGLCAQLVSEVGEPAKLILDRMSWEELFNFRSTHHIATPPTHIADRLKAVKQTDEEAAVMDKFILDTLSPNRGATIDDIRKSIEAQGLYYNNATLKAGVDRLKAKGLARQEGTSPRGVRYFAAKLSKDTLISNIKPQGQAD